MSLSFVKSAVLSSTDGVSHNEETTIDTAETQSLRASGGGAHKPLFEQLRSNKDAEEEKNAEFQRSLRGTATLDDEDCAHLNSVEQVKNERAHAVKSGIEREVALFRAAREDRALTQTVMDGDDDEIKDAAIKSKTDPTAGEVKITKKEAAKKIVPKFTIKKKRKRDPRSKDDNVDTSKKVASSQGKKTNNAVTGEEKQKIDNTKNDGGKKELSPPKKADDSDSDNGGGGLLGLGCYDSDSD